MKLTANGVRGIVIWDAYIHDWFVASELDNDLLHDQSIEFGTLFHGHNQASIAKIQFEGVSPGSSH